MTKNLRYSVKALLFGLFLIIFGSGVYAQQRTISGTVTDAETGETLIGVNITTVHDKGLGTITDIDGNYNLTVPDTVSQLVYSYVGYTSLTLAITSDVMDVEMSAGQELQEVVVVGYGTQKIKEVTSAVTSVKSEDFNNGNITDPIQLIQGKVAGLSISRPGGDPNADFTVRLRGLSTFGANTEPLIVIDGVQGADLNSVDPQDIASMDVLRDASAAAIYGTRAASGVILITTKKGQKTQDGKFANIDFSTAFTLEAISRKTAVLSGEDYLSFPNSTDFENNTDWIDDITHNAFSQAYNLSLNGAGETSNYRVGFNYRKGNGTVLNTGFEQFNGRVNITQSAFDDILRFNFNLSGTLRNESYSQLDALQYAARYNPTAPVNGDDDFSQEWGGYFQREAFYFYNPRAIIDQGTLDGKKYNIIGSVKVDVEPIKDLVFSAFYSLNQGSDLYGTYWGKNAYWTPYAIGSHLGYARKENQDRFNHMFELTGNYTKDFGDFNMKLLAGYSWQESIYENFWAFGKGFLTDGFTYNNLGAATGELPQNQAMDSYKSSSTLVGFFGRVNLNWKDIVFLTGNFRRDGSSMFGENNKWGNFGGVSAGVDVAQFFESKVVNRLKLRGGYGVTGNLPPEPYLSQLLFGPGGDKFFYNGEFIQPFAPIRVPNPDLKWEVKKELGFGLDFYLLDYRLSGSIDYYKNNVEDLIYNAPVRVPPNLLDRKWLNVGELQNTGIEFTLGAYVFQEERFTWNIDFNYTHYLSTKLVKITSDETTSEGTLYFGYLGAPFLTGVRTIQLNEGEAIGQIIAPIYMGIDSAGKLQYKDVNGDGEFNAQDDVENVGSGLPDFQIGIGNSFTFGNFYLNFFVRGVFGHSLVNVNNARYGVPVVMGIQSGMQQALEFADATDGPVYSDVHVEKANFVKLDNFAFGYNFNMSKSKYFSKIQLFLSGQNLFTITNYSGTTPEVRYSDSYDNNNVLAPGLDRENTYFDTRSFTLGLNMTF